MWPKASTAKKPHMPAMPMADAPDRFVGAGVVIAAPTSLLLLLLLLELLLPDSELLLDVCAMLLAKVVHSTCIDA